MTKPKRFTPDVEVQSGLIAVARAVTRMEKADPDLAGEAMDTQALADAAALVADLRRRLRDVELSFAGTIGRREGKITGTLSDGRQFKLERSSDRKEWDHEDWKRDVRRTITQRYTETPAIVVNAETGEPWERDLGHVLQDALAEAQEVHGSTPPPIH